MYYPFEWGEFWVTLVLIAAALAVIQGTCAYLILLERKVAAWTQDRLGPNRVGPWGLFQPLADGLKFLFKEEVIPGHVDKLFYLLAPGIAVSTALFAFAVVPFGPTTSPPRLHDYRTDAMVERSRLSLSAEDRDRLLNENRDFRDESRGVAWPQTESERAYLLAADRAHARATGEKSFEEQLAEYESTTQFVIAPHVDVGIVFVFAVTSLAVYGIVLGGWSSNSKYSFLGSLRSSAQLISYEIPMGLSVLGVFLVSGSLNLERIIDHQYYGGWNVLFQPLAALLFVTCIFAECNRLPFDLPEAEQELVGGYHTEYSAMKFAMFFLGEYTHMITTSFVAVAVFFGGWLLPWAATPGTGGPGDVILKVLIFAAKMALFIVFYMLVRWTIPRFRFDQLMGLAWKVLMPLALLNLVCVLVVEHYRLSHLWLLPASVVLFVGAAVVSLAMPRPRARATRRPGVGPLLAEQEMMVR